MPNYDAVYLDLEGTVIESWHDPLLINVGVLKEFLAKHNVTKVGIYSFAIYDANDREYFKRDMQSAIERALGVEITDVPSITDMMMVDHKYTGCQFMMGKKPIGGEIFDYITIRGKAQSFANFASYALKFTNALLIDDVVPDFTMEYHTVGCSIRFLNVTNKKNFL